MDGILKDQAAADPKKSRGGAVFRTCGGPSSSGHQGLFGSRPSPNFSSLPLSPSSSSRSAAPPLLPLPISKPAPVSAPSNGIAINVKPRNHQYQKKQGSAARRGDRAKREASPQKPIEKKEAAAAEFDGSLYSISPPPSSLPLPRFSITKPKPPAPPPATSCVVEAIGNGSGVDAGATDDLRRQLRL